MPPHLSHSFRPCLSKRSDFEKGFIRAETVAYDDFVKAGNLAGARDAGTLRSEGKEYVVQEGDVMLFRFNV